MRRSFVRVAIVAFLLLATASATLVVADTEYELTVAGAIDTPTETVTIEGSEFKIDHIGVVEPGETITVGVESMENYYLYLYNADGQSEYDDYYSASDDEVEIDTSSTPPGTYMLSLTPETEDGRQAVAPVVVEGYDLSLEYTETATINEEIEFTATAEPSGESNGAGVDVAIWDGNDVTEISLDQTGEMTYEGALPAADLGEGEYQAYAAVRGDDEVENYETVLAIENGATITVTADEGDGESGGDESDDDESDENESDDESTDEDTDPDETTSNESTGPADDANETQSDSNESGDGSEEHADSDGNADQNGDGETGDDSVLEPNEDDSDESTTDDDSLGTGGTAVVAIALAILGLARTARRQY
ncbi:T9SS type A sorting domain-containing protein [Halosolutus gelatinilyticus]|uniref:T9SS type A sorting domain-containing protein n=1 Tax=Halosolutus gelatinilyticus TaxID=2931975 RepID=UPI001FF4A97E|nr:T9SS type A sorting domain-containing protein [Halosolutus gelatinilyticus]